MADLPSADGESVRVRSPPHERSDMDEIPSAEDLATCERTSDRIPLTAKLLIFSQLCEGFTYFGLYIILQNFIQFPVPTERNKQPGALNLGRKTSTTMILSFYCLCNCSPIVIAILADQCCGKYKMLVISCMIYLVGLIVLVLTSIPVSIRAGLGLPGLIGSMILLGLAAGGYKTLIGPFMADQYQRTKTPIIREIKGKKKLIDPQLTIQRLFTWSYWAYNIGALTSELLTPTIEKYHSFWLAFTVALVIFPGAFLVLFFKRDQYIRTPPESSLVVRAVRITWKAIRNRWRAGKQPTKTHLLDYAKDVDACSASNSNVDNELIDNLKQTIHACRVFLFFPFFWMCYSQVRTSLTSQAAQMNVGPMSNDILQIINPLVIVVCIPFFDRIFHPALRYFHITLTSIVRITCGFILASLAMTWTAIVQYLIYSSGPNYDYRKQPCSSCQKFNNITMFWQIPSYFLITVSEIFAAITGLEYAYSNAPLKMKSVTMALFVCTKAIGTLLNLSFVSISVDPTILWLFVSMAILMFIIGILFHLLLRHDAKKPTNEVEPTRRHSMVTVAENLPPLCT